MLSAEFGYSIPEIDEYMDLQLFEGCIKYRDFSPPMGAMFKAFMNSFGDEKPKAGTAGMKYGGREHSKKDDSAEFMETMQAFGGSVNRVKIDGGDAIWQMSNWANIP